jgi:hypothetical protein
MSATGDHRMLSTRYREDRVFAMLCALTIRISAFSSWSFFMKHFLAAALVSLAIASPSSAQKLVDPTKVAPEYREAAEKRRAEQIRQQECAHKADAARERTTFLLQCLESEAGK